MTDYCVKIILYKGAHADQVVYYRNRLPMRLIEKYRWYFEYLAARIKVHNPRRKVDLTICLQQWMQGSDYVKEKTISLLSAKKSKVKKYQKELLTDDLFGFKSQEIKAKIEKTQRDIDALERGEFNYYVPVEHINRIDEFTQKER